MSLSAKKWAKLADEQQFKQLANAQASAANWRNGLIALTALLATVTIIKGPENASDMSSGGRLAVAILLGIAFVVLLLGSGLAMYAAYGFPDRDKLLTGESLRDWTASEARKSRKRMIGAAASFFLAVLLVGVAIGVTWFDDGADPSAFVVVETNPTAGQPPPEPICGELKSGSDGKLVIKAETPPGNTKTIPITKVAGISLVSECT
jgi:hypothetical protein